MQNNNIDNRLLKLFAKKADGPPPLLQRPLAAPVQPPIPFPNFVSTGGVLNPWNTSEMEEYARSLDVNPEQAYQHLQTVAQSTGVPFDQVFKQYSSAARQRQQEVFTQQQNEANTLNKQRNFAQSNANTEALRKSIAENRKTMPQDQFGNPRMSYEQQQAAAEQRKSQDEYLARQKKIIDDAQALATGNARSIVNPDSAMQDTVELAKQEEARTKSINDESNSRLKQEIRAQNRKKLEERDRQNQQAADSAKIEADTQLANAQALQDVAAAKDKAPVDRRLLDMFMNPTDNSAANYGILGGAGALLGGGLGAMFSNPQNRLRNALLFALLGGGLGIGGKYLADNYGNK